MVDGIGHTGTDVPMTEVSTLSPDIILIGVFVLCIVFGMFLAFGICKKAGKEKKN